MKLIKYFSFFVFFVLVAFSATAQKIETTLTYLTSIPDSGNNLIVYDQHRKLTIADFKGNADEANRAVAITSSGFMFKAGFRNANGQSSLQISVYCSFDKQQSWMKEAGKNPYILLHEQHHFDISYIGTLLFMKKVRESKFKQDNYLNKLKELYGEAVTKMEALQHQYDGETKNGTLKDKQAEWNDKIDQQLASLLSENN